MKSHYSLILMAYIPVIRAIINCCRKQLATCLRGIPEKTLGETHGEIPREILGEIPLKVLKKKSGGFQQEFREYFLEEFLDKSLGKL